MDAGRFLYNLEDEPKEELIKSLEAKIEEFFKWYYSFTNKEAIETIELLSNDIACDNSCALELSTMFSITDVLIPSKTILGILKKMGDKYNIEIVITV